ncbi:hypothetical protein BH11PLA2_BH11PLA2_12500 [soil metagenome]
MHLVLRIFLVGTLTAMMAVPSTAAPTTPTIEDGKALLAKAAAAETAKQYDKALDLYLRSYLAGQRSGEVRDQIHNCLRLTAQTKRHRDQAFRQFVLALPPSEALNLYAEIVQKLSTHHADKDKAKPQRLFALSLQEIERALSDAAFRKQNLPKASDAKLAKFIKSLKEEWPLRLPATSREARAALQELVRTALSELMLSETTSLILEAICGASGGLDESTMYLAPSQVPDKTDVEPSVTRSEMIDPMAGVGLIAIGRFRETTVTEFDLALQRLKEAGLRSLVLDLRGNSGGSFLAAIRLAERFVPAGALVSTIGQLTEIDGRVYSSASGMTALDVPLVVLVDARTMSAAEVFASAVKDAGRATLIGMNTFGKGSVQSPVPLDSADDADTAHGKPRTGTLMVTIAKVLTSNGTPLHGAGVAPHVIEPESTLQMRLATQRAAELTGMR